MNTPHPSRWAELFDQGMAIVDQANANGIAMNDWTFGGGTALMLQIGHRDSHDIDLFVSDAQYSERRSSTGVQHCNLAICSILPPPLLCLARMLSLPH
jgi:hypothetical protein